MCCTFGYSVINLTWNKQYVFFIPRIKTVFVFDKSHSFKKWSINLFKKKLSPFFINGLSRQGDQIGRNFTLWATFLKDPNKFWVLKEFKGVWCWYFGFQIEIWWRYFGLFWFANCFVYPFQILGELFSQSSGHTGQRLCLLGQTRSSTA